VSLVYWIRPEIKIIFNDQVSITEIKIPKREIVSELFPLYNRLLNRALQTDHIIELYFYKLYLPKEDEKEEYDLDSQAMFEEVFEKFKNVPEGAFELVKRIHGQTEMEEILYNELNWERD
jgi:hypothetical protein